MQEVIDRIFGSLSSQFIEPIGSGLWGIIPGVWLVAFLIALAALVFNIGSPQRGPKIAAVVGLAIFGFVLFGFGSDIVSAITGSTAQLGDAQATQQATNEIASNAEAARDAVVAAGK